jgi:hypothetical protein
MLTRKMNALSLCALVLLAASLAYVRAADTTKTESGDAQTVTAAQMVTAAQRAYDEAFERLATGLTMTPEECYVWSRRVMEAESRANKGASADAAREHAKRMADLKQVWGKMAGLNLVPKRPRAAVEYYVLEAEATYLDQRQKR